MSEKKSLEQALADMDAQKRALTEYKAKHAAELAAESDRIGALHQRLANLSQAERRKVLDAAGLKNVSAAPPPLSPLEASDVLPSLPKRQARAIKMGPLPNVLPLEIVSEQLNTWFGGSRADTDVIKLAIEQDLSVYATLDSPATYVPVGEGCEDKPSATAVAGSVVPLDVDTLQCLVLTRQGLANGWSNRKRVARALLPDKITWVRAYELQQGAKAPRVTPEQCLMERNDIEALTETEQKRYGELEQKPEHYPAIRRKLAQHGLVLISEAAEKLAEAHGLNAENFLKSRMLPAVRGGHLKAVTVADLGPIRPLSQASGFDAVSPADINAWLESDGFAKAIRWPESASTDSIPADEATPAQGSADAEPAQGLPLPLTTSDIAFCFDGVHWNEQEWKKKLGSKPEWVKGSIAIPGRRGVSETRWNPVNLGAALISRGYCKPNTIRARFQTKDQLKPWSETWKTYEADNFD